MTTAFLQTDDDGWSDDIPERREDGVPDVELGPLFPDIGSPEHKMRDRREDRS